MKSSMNRRKFMKNVALGTTTVAAAAGATATTGARSYAAIPGANERYRLGVIGCGGMAQGHMRNLLEMKESDNVEIVAVCDVYTKRLDAAAELTGGKPIKDYRQLLAQKDLDGVLIATPEHWHHKMVLDAISAGKHIYVEKPMTHSIAEARQVARKVKGSRIKLQVGVQGMSDESYEVANQYIRDGVLGKVVMAQIDYSRNYKDDFWAYDIDPDAKPGVNLDWEAWLGPARKRPWDPRRYFQWRRYWDYSGGIATDLFIHRVTRILKAVGSANMLNDTYPLGFRTRLHRKDLGIALETARTFEVPVHITSLVATIEDSLIAQGFGDEDMSNLARFVRKGASVPDGPMKG